MCQTLEIQHVYVIPAFLKPSSRGKDMCLIHIFKNCSSKLKIQLALAINVSVFNDKELFVTVAILFYFYLIQLPLVYGL